MAFRTNYRFQRSEREPDQAGQKGRKIEAAVGARRGVSRTDVESHRMSIRAAPITRNFG